MRKEMKKVLSLVLVGTILTGCAGSAGSKTAGGTDGDKAPAAVEKTEANEEGTRSLTVSAFHKDFHLHIKPYLDWSSAQTMAGHSLPHNSPEH